MNAGNTPKPKKALRLPPQERPLTARAIAELCGVELKTVHNWVADGKLPHFRTPGRHLRFQPDAVRTFLENIGYAPTRKHGSVVVLSNAAGAKRLSAALSGFECILAKNLWSALISVGRKSNEGLILDVAHLPAAELKGLLTTVQAELPELRVVLLTDDPKTTRVRGVTVLTWDAVARLPRLLQHR